MSTNTRLIGAYSDATPSRPGDGAIAELVALFADGVVVTAPELTDKYRHDRALDPAAGSPVAVVRAESTEDVQQVMRWASKYGVAVVPRGAGTGLSGGSTAVDGGIVLCTERMTTIVVQPDQRVVVAQPGALNAQVKAAVAAHGLWYPPDPSSWEICSIGGNVATNAGGLCCVKYGVTADYVLGLQVVLSDGTAVQLGGPLLKDAAGLSLTQLFVGSEGTLGIVTEVTLRLLPAPPTPTTLVATFASTAGAVDAVVAITSSLRPAMLEFMDSAAINAVEDLLHMGLDRDAAALLVARSDTGGPAADQEIEMMATLCQDHGAADVLTTSDEADGEAFLVARRMAIPALEKRGTLLLEDVGVPLPRLRELVLGVEAIARQHELIIAMVAHAGDGNTHPLIVFDPRDQAASAHAELAFGAIMELAIELGGTITGEHGVGRLKRPWLRKQVGDGVMALSHRVKEALDPLNILNPGAVFAADPTRPPQRQS